MIWGRVLQSTSALTLLGRAWLSPCPGISLVVDGAGGRDRAAILSYDRDMGCPSMLWGVVIWFIVVDVMGSVGDFAPQTVSKGLRCHVSHHLDRRMEELSCRKRQAIIHRPMIFLVFFLSN